MIRRNFGEEGFQALSYTNGACTRSSTAMRSRECLVQIDMHHIKAHVTRAGSTQHGVQVGTVIVHQAASSMHQFLNLGNLLLEESQRIGVGHHHSGNLRAMLSQQFLQGFHIHGAVVQRLHLYDVQSTDSSAGRVGSVG